MNDEEALWGQNGEVDSVFLEELQFDLELFGAAHSLMMPMESPANYGMTLVDDDGLMDELRLIDSPITRGMMAIREQHGGDHRKAAAVMVRVMALMRILQDSRLAPWIDRREEHVGVHSSVLHLAATLPLRVGEDFDVQQFLSELGEPPTDEAT